MTLRNEAALRGELNALTPRLRRYARALSTGRVGSSERADDLVHATLMRALGARHIGPPSELVIRLYATVTQLNREVALSSQQARAVGAGRPTLVASGLDFTAAPQTKLSAGLLKLPLEAREVLLLIALEGFAYAEAARILRISRSILISRLTQARIGLETSLRAGSISADGNLLDRHSTGAGFGIAARGPGGEIRPRAQAPHLRLVT